MQNSAKDTIKQALEAAGYRSIPHNIELLYQLYLNGVCGGNIGRLVRDNKSLLKR